MISGPVMPVIVNVEPSIICTAACFRAILHRTIYEPAFSVRLVDSCFAEVVCLIASCSSVSFSYLDFIVKRGQSIRANQDCFSCKATL